VNSSQGGGAKDTWVLRRAGTRPAPRGASFARRSRAAEPNSGPDPGPDGGAAAEQMQQQQQVGGRAC